MCLFSSCPLLYSKFHRSSVVPVLPWGLTFISKFLGVGLNFHDFNETVREISFLLDWGGGGGGGGGGGYNLTSISL